MSKRDIVAAMEKLRVEMFRADVGYDIICDFSGVMGRIEQEAREAEYKPASFAEFAASRDKEV